MLKISASRDYTFQNRIPGKTVLLKKLNLPGEKIEYKPYIRKQKFPDIQFILLLIKLDFAISGPLMFSPMLFFSIWSYIPLVFLFTGSWFLYLFRKYRAANGFALLPLLSILSGLTAFTLIIFIAKGSLVWH